MKKIIENEVYKYKLQMKEYYNQSGQLTSFPERKPLQCMVLKKFCDLLSTDISYSENQLFSLISNYICFPQKEVILKGLLFFEFLSFDKAKECYTLNSDYKEHYLSFLGLQ